MLSTALTRYPSRINEPKILAQVDVDSMAQISYYVGPKVFSLFSIQAENKQNFTQAVDLSGLQQTMFDIGDRY